MKARKIEVDHNPESTAIRRWLQELLPELAELVTAPANNWAGWKHSQINVRLHFDRGGVYDDKANMEQCIDWMGQTALELKKAGGRLYSVGWNHKKGEVTPMIELGFLDDAPLGRGAVYVELDERVTYAALKASRQMAFVRWLQESLPDECNEMDAFNKEDEG